MSELIWSAMFSIGVQEDGVIYMGNVASVVMLRQ